MRSIVVSSSQKSFIWFPPTQSIEISRHDHHQANPSRRLVVADAAFHPRAGTSSARRRIPQRQENVQGSPRTQRKQQRILRGLPKKDYLKRPSEPPNKLDKDDL